MAILTTHANKSKLRGVHYTTAHTGKMTGIESLSTSPMVNPNCIQRRENGDTICAHCFAVTLLKKRKQMQPGLEENGRILSGSVLPMDVIPTTPTRLFRLEAFGDLINDIQVINYFNICRKNPDTLFALWTKNPQYIKRAIADGHTKPNNLQIVLSSALMNKETRTAFPFVDKVFTVYDSKTIKANGVEINCGSRSCLECQRCYRPNPEGTKVLQIREKLK